MPGRQTRAHADATTRAARSAWGLLGAAALTLGGVLVGTGAHAALVPVPDSGADARLLLRADPYPLEDAVVRADRATPWLIEAYLHGREDAASLSVEVHTEGALADHSGGLVATVSGCTLAWTGLPDAPRCPGERSTLFRTDPGAQTASSLIPLGVLEASAPRQFLVELILDSDADASVDDLTATVGVGFVAEDIARDSSAPSPPLEPSPRQGDADVVVPVGEGLAATGAPGRAALLAAATASLAAGILALGRALSRDGRRRS